MNRTRAAAAVTWFVAIVGYVVWAKQTGTSPAEAVQQLNDVLTGSVWGPLVFIAIYVARPLVFFPATLLTILGGVVFGLVGGSVLAVVASNLSTAVTYAVGAYFATETVADRGRTLLGGRIQKAVDRPFETTLAMRLMYFPYDLVGYMAGFARLRYLPFALATAIGSLPGTVAFVGFGASVGEVDGSGPSFDWRVLAASVILTALGFGGARLLRQREQLTVDESRRATKG